MGVVRLVVSSGLSMNKENVALPHVEHHSLLGKKNTKLPT